MEPKITIGLPIYNGEKIIRKCIDSIISQTYQEFILIISDNNSTDSTSLICKEFEKNDKRIKYIKQKKNIGWLDNFLFLLEQSKSKYFVWIAVDDFWAPTFLQKNISILEAKKDVVASIGKTYSGSYYQKFNYNQNDGVITQLYKKSRRHFLSFNYYGTAGNQYNNRIKTCLKSSRFALCLYSVFRTDELKKSISYETTPWDWTVILKILKYGNIHVIDEFLLCRSSGGVSNTNAIYNYFSKRIKFSQLLFPKIPFTKWCIEHLGKQLFIQNLFFFIRINCSGPIIILLDLVKYIKSKNNKKLRSEKI